MDNIYLDNAISPKVSHTTKVAACLKAARIQQPSCPSSKVSVEVKQTTANGVSTAQRTRSAKERLRRKRVIFQFLSKQYLKLQKHKIYIVTVQGSDSQSQRGLWVSPCILFYCFSLMFGAFWHLRLSFLSKLGYQQVAILKRYCESNKDLKNQYCIGSQTQNHQMRKTNSMPNFQVESQLRKFSTLVYCFRHNYTRFVFD